VYYTQKSLTYKEKAAGRDHAATIIMYSFAKLLLALSFIEKKINEFPYPTACARIHIWRFDIICDTVTFWAKFHLTTAIRHNVSSFQK